MEEQVQKEINRLDERIAELGEAANEATEDGKEAIDQQIENLESLKSDLQNGIAQLRMATTEQMDDVRQSLNQTMNEIDRMLTVSQMENEKEKS